MSEERLSPQRAVRLLRAKAGELEAMVLQHARTLPPSQINDLRADLALIAGLLADHIERTERPLPAMNVTHIFGTLEAMKGHYEIMKPLMGERVYVQDDGYYVFDGDWEYEGP